MFWFELQSETWILLAKFHLFWFAVFSITGAVAQAFVPDQGLVVAQNGILAVVFLSLQQYCRMEA